MAARKRAPTERRDTASRSERKDAEVGSATAALAEATPGSEAGLEAWLDPIEDSVLEVAPDSYFGEDASTLGDRIAAARLAAGLTQAGLAARLGVGAKLVSTWENDRSEPRSNRLAMLAGLLNVSVSWLLTGGGEGVAPPEAQTSTALNDAPRPMRFVIDVADLEATTRFYGDLLGGALAASAPDESLDAPQDVSARQDFIVFGHRISAFMGDRPTPRSLSLTIELGWDEWRDFAARLRTAGGAFEAEPGIQRLGAPTEQAHLSLVDPDGNHFTFIAQKHGESGGVDDEAVNL